MAHIHSIYDTDSHFKIDPITKKIECEAQKKVRLTVGDHESERFTFQCPRHVEGHDMMDCNVVEVHYINIDATDKTKVSKSYFPVEDKQVSDESDEIVIFSWLIKGTATKYVGTLGFSVRFACITNAPIIDYQWLTDINSSVSVGDTIFNSEYIATEYEDALAAWKAEIEKKIATGGGAVTDEQIENAVAAYLLENPIKGVTNEQVASAVEAYLLEHPVTGGSVSADQIAQAVANYFVENPVKCEVSKEEFDQLSDTIEDLTEVLFVEPKTEDIPKVFFDEAIPQTKDDVVTKFRYISKTKDFEGYAEFKAQGNSSMSYPKKNMTVKMYKDEALQEKLKVDFKGWGEQNKHVYKANWIDLTHARNIVSARIWADIVKSRSNYTELPELLRTSPNQGAVDGFPVKVYSQGIYQGRYTLNIPKDAWMANMDKDLDTHCILCSEGYTSGCFRQASMAQWTDEIHDTVPSVISNRWIEVINFVMNSTDEEFKANLDNYIDVQSVIDYHLFGLASCGLDAYGKNQLYFTYDGIKWYASMYDMDSTWGLFWNGGSFVATDYARTNYEDYKNEGVQGNLLYVRLEQLFHEELKERWIDLRKNSLSNTSVINHFERFTDIASSDLVKEDYATTTANGAFTGIPQQGKNNIQQLRSYAVARMAWTDSYVARLGGSGDEEPTDKTLTSISATYTGGNVKVGTAMTDLTGITVTATYSDGSTENLTDYTLSGTIAEGENTITVSYGGKTTTFIVIGESDDVVIDDTHLVYSLGETSFDGTEGIDTGVKLQDTVKDYTVFIDFTAMLNPNKSGEYGLITAQDANYPWAGWKLSGAYAETDNIVGFNRAIFFGWNTLWNTRHKAIIKHSNGKFYVGQDGATALTEIDDGVIKLDAHTTPLRIGCTTSMEMEVFTGTIHNVKVWFEAKTDAECLALLK